MATAEEITRDFTACGHSVELINGYVAGTYPTMENETTAERKETVARNVEHLVLQAAKDWYTSDSVSRTAPANKTAIASAITAGNTYVAA